MKKFSLILMTLIFSLIMVFSVSAANAGTEITVSEEIGKQDNIVIVSVSITGNTGFKAYGMTLSYDRTVLELVEINAGDLSATGLFQGTERTGIVGYASNKLIKGDGVLFTASFKILTNEAGKYEVAVDVDAIGVTADDVMNAKVENGSVSVEHQHSFGDWTVTKEAKCTEKGEESRVCSECKEKETRDIAAKGHSFGDWAVTKEAKCTEKGEETKTCACGEKETRDIAAKGHSFGDWAVTKEAKCTEKGEETKTCACGEKETRDIAAKGHSFGDWAVTKEAKCTEKGEETKTCACGEKETRDIAAKGHSFGNWAVTKEPAEGVAGEEARKCSNCDTVETRAIDPLPEVGDASIAIFFVLVVCALGTVVVCKKMKPGKSV